MSEVARRILCISTSFAQAERDFSSHENTSLSSQSGGGRARTLGMRTGMKKTSHSRGEGNIAVSFTVPSLFATLQTFLLFLHLRIENIQLLM